MPICFRSQSEKCFRKIADAVKTTCLEVETNGSPALYKPATKSASKLGSKLGSEVAPTATSKLAPTSASESAPKLRPNPHKFTARRWQREGQKGEKGGGGIARTLRGKCIEKAGVNVSTVFGTASPQMVATAKNQSSKARPQFWAAGVSVVIHPTSPLMPSLHMNLRRFELGSDRWFGGGCDITPLDFASKPATTAAAIFHRHLKQNLNGLDKTYYPKFSKWCDEYFYLPHRGETRGLGGVFFDQLRFGDEQKGINLAEAVGGAFTASVKDIAAKWLNQRWTDAQKQTQLAKRGRYVEFNLLYDRGTRFGIMSNAHSEAVLMSLPPVASW